MSELKCVLCGLIAGENMSWPGACIANGNASHIGPDDDLRLLQAAYRYRHPVIDLDVVNELRRGWREQDVVFGDERDLGEVAV